MGRTLPTATMQVYQFESEWQKFLRAPRAVDREAFAELVAFAHFHAAPLAHAASPYGFEMILLTMLVGLVGRAEALEQKGVMQFYVPFTKAPDASLSFQNRMRAIMLELRQRLAKQGHELFTFARALRHQDQKALRALLAVTQSHDALVPQNVGAPTDEMLLAALMQIMRRIRQLEKQYGEGSAIISPADWSQLCRT